MKKAIVLGGTHDHIRLIEILKGRGYHTILIDYYLNPPARAFADEHIRESTLDQEKIKSIALEINPEIIIATCIDQALLTMAYVSEELDLPCHISYKTALELTNKVYMKQRFVENNIPTSKFHIINSNDSINVDDLHFPLVVKPADSNSSKGITKVDREEYIENPVKHAFSHSRAKQVVIEEFVNGYEYSVDVIIVNNEAHVLMVTNNVKSKLNQSNFTITQGIYPATTDAKILNKIKLIAEKIAKAYNIENGPLLIQILNNDGNLNVIEFSSRIGGGSKHHFIKAVTGFDLLDYFLDIILNNNLANIKITSNYTNAVLNYIYISPGKICQYIGFNDLKDKGIINDIFYYKQLGDIVEKSVSSGDRPLGYLLVGNNLDELNHRAKQVQKTVKILDETQNNIIIDTNKDHV